MSDDQLCLFPFLFQFLFLAYLVKFEGIISGGYVMFWCIIWLCYVGFQVIMVGLINTFPPGFLLFIRNLIGTRHYHTTTLLTIQVLFDSSSLLETVTKPKLINLLSHPNTKQSFLSLLFYFIIYLFIFYNFVWPFAFLFKIHMRELFAICQSRVYQLYSNGMWRR